MTAEMNDERLAALLNAAPHVEASADLRDRILQSYDAIMARPTLRNIIVQVSNVIWPGVPMWQPGAALAASLMIGVVAGHFVPYGNVPSSSGDETVFSLNGPSMLDLGSED